MKKCSSCNIEFNTNDVHCPLCYNLLVGDRCDVMFPKNIRFKTNSLIMKIVLFASIASFLVFAFIEMLIWQKLFISLYVGLGLITNFAVVSFMLKNYQNVLKIFGKYGLLIIVLLLVWYYFTKSKIITNYIIPSVCIFELIFNFVVGIILRRNYLIRYSSQIIINLILLILPIILVAFKMTSNNILSYICFLLAVISISGLLIFFFDDIKEELLKVFNI